jgi:hypothetical protein
MRPILKEKPKIPLRLSASQLKEIHDLPHLSPSIRAFFRVF